MYNIHTPRMAAEITTRICIWRGVWQALRTIQNYINNYTLMSIDSVSGCGIYVYVLLFFLTFYKLFTKISPRVVVVVVVGLFRFECTYIIFHYFDPKNGNQWKEKSCGIFFNVGIKKNI